MTDETADLDLDALAALCAAHPGPHYMVYEDGTRRVTEDDWLEEMANAVPALLALLAARAARIAALESLLREKGITVPA